MIERPTYPLTEERIRSAEPVTLAELKAIAAELGGRAIEENGELCLCVVSACCRCGGAGGWAGWPGFKCFRCEDANRTTIDGRSRSYVPEKDVRVTPAAKLLREWGEELANFDAGHGALTNAELRAAKRREAAHDARMNTRNDRLKAYGFEPDLIDALTTTPEDDELARWTSRDRAMLSELAGKAVRFDLSEKQQALIGAKIAALVGAPERLALRNAERAAMPHYGEIGGHVELTGTVEKLVPCPGGRFGPSTLVVLRTEGGGVVKWWTSGKTPEPAELVAARGTVKTHEESDFGKATVLSRVRWKYP